LPPGDALFGAVLGAWLRDTSGRTPTSQTPELALAGSFSWFQPTNDLPATTAVAPATPEAAPTLVTAHQNHPAESATRPSSRPSDGDLRPPAPPASPLTFRSPEATTADHALPIAASGGAVTAPATGLITNAPASVGSQPMVPTGGTVAPNSPAAMSFLSLLNPPGSTSTATPPSVAAAPGQSGQVTPNPTDLAAVPAAPLAAAAPVTASKAVTACTAQQSTVDPWGGDPWTNAHLHTIAGNGPSACAAPATDQGQGAPPPGGGPVNVLVNDPAEDGTSVHDTHSETSQTVTKTGAIVAAFNDSLLIDSGMLRLTGWSVSTDNGQTFVDKGSLPFTSSVGGDVGDPSLAADLVSGRVYLATIAGNFNQIAVFRSDDDGNTFQQAVAAAPGRSSDDKEWITVDNAAGAGQGNVYLVMRDFGGGNGIFLFRSTDQGATFGPNGGVSIVTGGAVQGAWVTTGPDHSVDVFWYDTGAIRMRKSTDQGQTFGPTVTVTSLRTTGVNGDLSLGGFRSNAFPQAVVNPSSGSIYVTFDDKGTAANDRADVFFTQSTDGGTTWSTPVKVNDGPVGRDAWQPTITVSPSGAKVGIFWYDRRNDSANTRIDRYGVVGDVAGDAVVFGENMRISDQSFPPVFGVDPGLVPTYMGDYDQAVATTSSFLTTWGDNRDPSRGHSGNHANVRLASIPVAVAGPSVVSTTPSGTAFGIVPSMRVTFDEEINPATFTPDKVLFLNPSAGQIPVSDIQPVAGSSNRRFDISFANQTTLGTYTMIIGPDVEDTNGNQMDQDHNGIPGEIPQDEYVARFTLTPPRITDSTPAFGAILTPQMVSSVQVTFNEPMNPTTFTPDKITTFVGPHGSITVTSVTPVANSNNTKFDIHFAAQAFTGYYTMVIGPNIQDTAGHSMDQQFVERFGIQGPRITASALNVSNPLPNQANRLRVTFSESMNPATFTTSAVTLTGPGGPVTINSVTAVSGTNNTQFDINFSVLTVAGLYTPVVGPHIRDTFGNEMDQNNNLIPGEDPGDAFTATFIVQGPRVSAQTPTGGFGPSSTNSVQVTFNESMNPATFTPDQVVSFTRTNGTVRTDLSSTITSITPVSGSNNTRFNVNFQATGITGRYVLIVGPDIEDTFGNQMDQNQDGIPGEVPGDEYTATFTLLGPKITASTPSGSIAPQAVGMVQVTFSESMNPATFTPDQVVSFTRTNGTVVTDLSSTITSITPVSGSNNTRFNINFQSTGITGQYALTVGPDILDTFGNAMDQNNNLIPGEDPGDEYTATFSLQGARITASTPSGSNQPQMISSVQVTFNESMNPATFTPDQVVSFTRTNGTQVTDLLSTITTITPVSGSNNMRFNINFRGTGITGQYALTVGPDILDTFGNQMDQDGDGVPGEVPRDQYTATFTLLGPRITLSTPSGSTLPQAVSFVQVTFNESMNPATFTPDQVVSFTRTNGTQVTDLLSTITSITPVAGSNNTRFNINFQTTGTTGLYNLTVGPDILDTFGNAMDQNGNLITGEVPGDEYTATFTLLGAKINVSTPTLSPPVLGQVSSVRVTFNESMDPTTFTPDKVASFTGPNGAIAVAGVFAVGGTNPPNSQFDITFATQTATGKYTMVIGPNIEDYFGNEMDQNGNLIPGEDPGDQYTAIFGIAGPKILSSAPIGNNLPGMIHSLRVTFNESMDPASFTPDKVASFQGPDGSELPVTDVQPVPFTGDTQFDISFDPAGAAGNYKMVIGPDIHDLFGNEMDQDGDLVPGQIPQDQYTATFTVQKPAIVSNSPSGTAVPPIDHVQVTFNVPMNPDTFTPAQIVSFRGPGGDIPVLNVSPVPDSNNTQFTISFDPQGKSGAYTMVIGPDIQDTYGNRTGQNYTANFTIANPQIVGLVRNGDVTEPPTSVRVTFNEAVVTRTFTPSQVTSFTDPNGHPIAVNSITEVHGSHHRQFEINFDPQMALGMYHITIGPNIFDKFGNAMAAPFQGTFGYTLEIVVNGGFEMGFTGWSPGPGWVIRQPGHNSANAAGAGNVGTTTPLSQNITTVVGQPYTFSFWYSRVGQPPGEEIHAFFGGQNVYNEVNTPPHDYQFHSFVVTATSTTTTILFQGRNDPDYDLLDDVSVMPFRGSTGPGPGGSGRVPEQQPGQAPLAEGTALLPAGLAAELATITGLREEVSRGLSQGVTPFELPAALPAPSTPRPDDGHVLVTARSLRTIDQVFASLRERTALPQSARLASDDLPFAAAWSDPLADPTFVLDNGSSLTSGG
jgi:hypothetical protein